MHLLSICFVRFSKHFFVNRYINVVKKVLQIIYFIKPDSFRMYILIIFFFCSETEDKCVKDKCSEIYQGPSPCSEIECQNIRDYVLKLKPVPVLATCLHSYGQYFLWPYGYAKNVYPENYKEIKELALDAALALEVIHISRFTIRAGVQINSWL